MRIFAALGLATMLVACSSKPSEQDVRVVLADNMPKTVKSAAAIEQLQTEISSADDGSLVKFKAVLKTSEPLFVTVGFEDAATGVGATDLGSQVSTAAQQLAPSIRETLRADIERATTRPPFIKVATPAGASSGWYGSFKVRKVVDKWLASDFKTEVEPKLSGEPKASFPNDAIEASNAKTWFSEQQPKQQALLQRIADAQKLQQKDAELVQQQAATQQERQAKEALLAAQEKQARRLPLQVGFRRAAVGGTLVMRMQSLRPMTVKVEVARGLQRFTRELQLTPGQFKEIGHLEGWGFKPGDQVNLSNPSFDAATFVVR